MTENNNNNNKETGKGFSGWLSTKHGTAILSLFLAIILWFTVVTVIQPGSTKIMQVPVDFTFNDAAYKSQGLSIIDQPSTTISLTVQGDGSVLGGLTTSDILVYPDYTSVKGSGTYTLPIVVRAASTVSQFEIIEDDIGYVDVTFDKLITSTFNITVNVTGIETAEGYYMDVPLVSPGTVVLTGPEKALAPVESVVANVILEEQRTESAIVTSRLTYLDSTGEVVDSTDISADIEQVEVTIPIYRIKELPLTIDYTGVPTGYDPSVLGATLSHKTIKVAGPSSQLDTMESVSAGIVDLSSFVLGEDIVTNITLPENVKNVDGLQSVTISFDTFNYSTKLVTVTEIRALNIPTGVSVTFPSEQVNSVLLVGEASELEALSDSAVVARVDLSPSNLSVKNGQQNMPAQITVAGTNSVFATGSYTILCDIQTTSSSQSEDDSAQE